MATLSVGTKVRAVHDLASISAGDGDICVIKGMIGHISAVGPDAQWGWYGLIFDDEDTSQPGIPYAGFVKGPNAVAEVIS